MSALTQQGACYQTVEQPHDIADVLCRHPHIFQNQREDGGGGGGGGGSCLAVGQTPNSGLRHTSFRRQAPESGVRSVAVGRVAGGRGVCVCGGGGGGVA